MHLKRLYEEDVSAELKALRAQRELADNELDRKRLEKAIAQLGRSVGAVRILHLSKRWHVGPRIIEKGAAEGWLSLADGHVVLRGEDGPVRFRILTTPNAAAGQHYYDCEHVEN